MAMVMELYRLIALNSLPVAHFAVGHSIQKSSAKQGHGYVVPRLSTQDQEQVLAK
jgi:hypothetical protein